MTRLNDDTVTRAWDDAYAFQALIEAKDAARRALSDGWHGYRAPSAEMVLSLVIVFAMGCVCGGMLP